MLGKVAIIGGGKMGEVIASGILSHRLVMPEELTVTDVVVERREFLRMEYGVQVTEDNVAAVKEADTVILAVKPQEMPAILQAIAPVVGDKLIMSIAAGITIDALEAVLGKNARIIRAMPNTPALVGAGAAAIAVGSQVSEFDVELGKAVFGSVGIVVVVDESKMDAVTGLSGSGPAYVFIIIDALSDAGVLMGLSRDVAVELATQTLFGAAKLCLEAEKHPAELRDMVTSPGGTTIAGVKALEEGGLRATLIKAVEAATLRSKELGEK